MEAAGPGGASENNVLLSASRTNGSAPCKSNVSSVRKLQKAPECTAAEPLESHRFGSALLRSSCSVANGLSWRTAMRKGLRPWGGKRFTSAFPFTSILIDGTLPISAAQPKTEVHIAQFGSCPASKQRLIAITSHKSTASNRSSVKCMTFGFLTICTTDGQPSACHDEVSEICVSKQNASIVKYGKPSLALTWSLTISKKLQCSHSKYIWNALSKSSVIADFTSTSVRLSSSTTFAFSVSANRTHM